MKEYTSENPIFYDKINMVERADLVNDQNKNESAKQLLQNTLVLKKQLDTCLGENGKNGKLELADGINADDLVSAINEVFMLGSEIKKKLAENLTAIGITSSAGETMEQLLGKVLDAVDTSGDTVTEAVLLTGYTAHNLTGEQITGGMTDNGAWTGNTSGSGNVAIPKGYHNGRGYVAGQGAYDKGVADADARTNPNSANYKNGYSAGVSSMDGTINNLNGQINNLNNQISQKNQSINDLNKQIADLQTGSPIASAVRWGGDNWCGGVMLKISGDDSIVDSYESNANNLDFKAFGIGNGQIGIFGTSAYGPAMALNTSNVLELRGRCDVTSTQTENDNDVHLTIVNPNVTGKQLLRQYLSEISGKMNKRITVNVGELGIFVALRGAPAASPDNADVHYYTGNANLTSTQSGSDNLLGMTIVTPKSAPITVDMTEVGGATWRGGIGLVFG